MTRARRCLLVLLCCAPLSGLAAPAQAARGLGTRTLRAGAHGGDVRALQRLLTRSGFGVPADGRFGPGTRRALQRFQRAATLAPTGVAGAGTIRLLRAAASSASTAPSVTEGGAAFATAPATGPDAPSPPGPVDRATLTGDGRAQAPAGAPAAVVAIIAAADRIATLPYRYGGGHAGFDDTAYDCSGSVSYALRGAALVPSPLVSGDLAAWGLAGAGRWVTVYANGGHVYMVVAGLRFDTSGQRQSGSRWQAAARSGTGFTVRHPAGL